jgi:hypothetical protein
MGYANGHWGLIAGCCAAALCGYTPVVQAQVGEIAQVGSPGGTAAPGLAPPPVNTGRQDVFAKPGRAEDAMVAGDWLIYPSAFGGFIYDSNVSQRSAPQGSAGVRLAPAVLAENTSGLFKTTLYGNADGRFYFRDIPGNGSVIAARVGGTETYTPLPDLILNGQADFTRQQDLFTTLGVDKSLVTLNPTGVGLAPTSNPSVYNQFSGAVSVQKNFSQAFVTLGGSIVDLTYDRASGTTAPSPNGVTYTGNLRGGVWITPALYGYVEGAADSRDYDTSTLSSSGYRVVGGLGTDQIGLVRGEIYGGYQAESYNARSIGTASGPVVGARGHYYPLPELTLNLAVDETLGVSLLAATPGVPGTSTKVDTALLSADYALARQWSANARGGFIHTEYQNNPRRDDAWAFGGTITYSLLRNVGLTLDYQHTELSSNVANQGFTRDVVTVGATWRY